MNVSQHAFDQSINVTTSGIGTEKDNLTGNDNKMDVAVPNSIGNLEDESNGVNQANEVTENYATVVPAAPQILDADEESQFDFELVYLWILVPAVILAILFARFTSTGKKMKDRTDPDSARGQFRKTDRLLRSPISAPENDSPSIDLDLDDEIFSGETFDSKSKLNEKFSTTTGFSVALNENISNESVDLNLSEEDGEIMFGEGKEAAFDQLVDRDDPADGENEAFATEAFAPNAPAPFADAESERKRNVWRKKKFPPKEDAAPTDTTAVVPDRSTDQRQQLASLDVIQGEFESARAKLATALENLEASESRNSELRSRLDKATSDFVSIEKLTADNEKLKQERDDACQRESDLMNQFASLQPLANEAEAAKKEALALTQQIKDVQTDKDRLEQRLDEFELKAERQEESNRQIIELHDKMKLADEAKDQLQHELDATLNAAERSKQLAQELDQIKANLETSKLEKIELATKLDAESVRANALEERSVQLDDKIAQIELLENQIDVLKNELDDARTQGGADDGKSKTPNQSISDRTKIKFTQLYRAYERERQLRKELEANLMQAEEQRDHVAHDLKELKKTKDS